MRAPTTAPSNPNTVPTYNTLIRDKVSNIVREKDEPNTWRSTIFVGQAGCKVRQPPFLVF